MRRTRLVLVCLGLLVTAPACGDDDTTHPPLEIRGGENGQAMFYEPATPSAEVGTYAVRFVNVGAVRHELSFVDPSGEIIATSFLDGGQNQSFDVEFEEAGTYQMICREPGHTEAGMAGTLTVTEAA